MFNEFLSKQLLDRWRSPWAAGAIALVVGVGVFFVFKGVTLADFKAIPILAAAITIVGIGTLWRVTTRRPKAPKKRIGVLVIIQTEGQKHDKRIRADFVSQLRQLLQHDEKHQISVVEFSSAQAADVADKKDAIRAMVDSRCHCLIYGQARRRKVNGEESHVLDLHWCNARSIYVWRKQRCIRVSAHERVG
jgi:hypothetical protein